jgi:hypothetical protein
MAGGRRVETCEQAVARVRFEDTDGFKAEMAGEKA